MSRDARKHDVKLRAIGVIDFAKEFIIRNVPCKKVLGDSAIVPTLLTNNEENTAKVRENHARRERKTLTSLHRRINNTTLVLGYENMRNTRAVHLTVTYAWPMNQKPTRRPS